MPKVIKFSCPECNSLFEVSELELGMNVECQNCNNIFTIPSSEPTLKKNNSENNLSQSIFAPEEINAIDWFMNELIAPLEDNTSIGQEVKPEVKNAKNLASYKSDDFLFDIYVNEIEKYPRLSLSAEIDCVNKIINGDENAIDKLITSNLRLVIHVVKSYAWADMDILDLIQEGNMGLIKAVSKYNIDKGSKFSTYAIWWIKQGINRYIANHKELIRIPIQSNHKKKNIKKYEHEFKDIHGVLPSDEELCKLTSLSLRTIKLLKEDMTIFSFSGCTTNGDSYSLYSHYRYMYSSYEISPAWSYAMLELLNRTLELFENLEEREKLIINMRFGLDGNNEKTLDEISNEIGRTRERVRQIEKNGLNKIKDLVREDFLLDYSPSINYQDTYLTNKIDCICNGSIDEYNKLLIVDIFEYYNHCLTLDEIKKRLITLLPKCYFSDVKLRHILRSSIFTKIKSKTMKILYSMTEWSFQNSGQVVLTNGDNFSLDKAKNRTMVESNRVNNNDAFKSTLTKEELDEFVGFFNL